MAYSGRHAHHSSLQQQYATSPSSERGTWAPTLSSPDLSSATPRTEIATGSGRQRQTTEPGIPLVGRQLLSPNPSMQYRPPPPPLRNLRHGSNPIRRLSTIPDQSEPPSPLSPRSQESQQRSLPSPRSHPSQSHGHLRSPQRMMQTMPLPNPHDSHVDPRRTPQASRPVIPYPPYAPAVDSTAVLPPAVPPKDHQASYVAPGRRRKVSDPEASPADITDAIARARRKGRAAEEMLARGPQAMPASDNRSSWASDESTPTQSPELEQPATSTEPSRGASTEVLRPVHLTALPTADNRPGSSGHRGALASSQLARQLSGPSGRVTRGPLVRESSGRPAVTVTAPDAPTETAPRSNVVRLPDGREIPIVRSDFGNMRRISVPRTSLSSSGGTEDVQRAAGAGSVGTFATHTLAGQASAKTWGQSDSASTARHAVPRKPAPALADSYPAMKDPSTSRRSVHDVYGNEARKLPGVAVTAPPSSPKLKPLVLGGPQSPLRTGKTQHEPRRGVEGPRSPQTERDSPLSGRLVVSQEDAPTRQTFGPDAGVFREAASQIAAARPAFEGSRAPEADRGVSAANRRRSLDSATDEDVLTEAQAYARTAMRQRESNRAPEQVHTRDMYVEDRQCAETAEKDRRMSISSEKTAIDEDEAPVQHRRGSISDFTQKAVDKAKTRSSLDRHRDRRVIPSDLAAPPSAVPEVSEPRSGSKEREAVGARNNEGRSQEGDGVPSHKESALQTVQSHELRHQPSVTFPAAVLARPNTRGRPGTSGTLRSILSFHSRAAHQRSADVCPHCFRAGFDCALNLSLNSGTAGRRTFQQFVAGILPNTENPAVSPTVTPRLLSRPGTRGSSRPVTRGSLTAGGHFERLGSVAFGESALSRPVTRGAVEQMLADRGAYRHDVNEKVPYEDFLARLHKVAEEQQQQQQQEQGRGDWDQEQAPGKLQEIDTEKSQMPEAMPKQWSISPANRPAVLSEKDEVAGADDAHSLGGTASPVPASPPWHDPHQQHFRLLNASSRPVNMVRKETGMTMQTVQTDLGDASIRSEGKFTLRTGLTFGFFGVVLFAVQILNSGLSGPLSDQQLDQPPSSTTAMGGRLAFFWGEVVGVFLGACLYRFGAWILVGDITLAGVFALVAGFSQTYWALNVLRGMIGLCGGVIFIFSIGNLLDMLPSAHLRFLGLLTLVSLVTGPQLVGPWVAQLFQTYLDWRWLYWAAAIATACAVPILMLLAREPWINRVGTPNAVHDGRHGPGQGVRIFILPISLLCVHPHLLLCSIAMVFALGIYSMLLVNVHSLWVNAYHFTDNQAALCTTICSLLGLVTAVAWALITAAWRQDKPKRRLHLDENGYIRVTPAKRPEQRLFKVAGGLLISAVTLFLLGVTTRSDMVHWSASALLFAILAGGVIITAIGSLHYPIEVYHPASALVIATSFDDLPNMEMLTEEQHWGRQFTLSAVAGLAGLTLATVGIVTFLAQSALRKIGFSTLCVILACCALFAAGSTVLLLRLGPVMRTRAWQSHSMSMRRAEEWRSNRVPILEDGLGLHSGSVQPGSLEHLDGQHFDVRPSQDRQFSAMTLTQARQSQTLLTPIHVPARPPPFVLPPGVAGDLRSTRPATPPGSPISRVPNTATRPDSRLDDVRRFLVRGRSHISQMSERYPILPQISPADRPAYASMHAPSSRGGQLDRPNAASRREESFGTSFGTVRAGSRRMPSSSRAGPYGSYRNTAY
ncbi:unnamed protein product [Parajaminaea phylloscopi]